jgi:hypothetical protein
MKNKILEVCAGIEAKENIKILFLIESGSRAWGWASDDSDYDVRGVYVQDYLQVDNITEQLNLKVDKLDIELWDLRKFLSLMKRSNPSVWEWISSDIVYLHSSLLDKLKVFFVESFNRHALKKHYASMAKQNFYKYISGTGDMANLKKYVYVLRSIGCIRWIEKYDTPPAKDYNYIINLLPNRVSEFFEKIVHDKQASESLIGPRNKEVENYVVKTFEEAFPEDTYHRFSSNVVNTIFKTYAGGWKQ